MRYIAVFFIGLFSLFYSSALVSHFTKKAASSYLGLILIFIGIIINFTTISFLYPPLNHLFSVFLIGCGLGQIAFHFLSEGFLFSKESERDFFRKHEKGFERFLEILPGATTWLAITSPIWLSFALPFAVAYILLLADVYWLFTSWKISVLVVVGYKRMEKAIKTDWLEKLKSDFPDKWGNYYHLILLPMSKEELFILQPAIDAIFNSDYPKDKIFLAVGFEEKYYTEKTQKIADYFKENGHKIGGAFATIHPAGLPGEVPGPGTNRNFMVRNAVKELKKRGINPKDVIVTTLDADFVIHKRFLAGALHKYLSLPEDVRDKISMTGVFLYNNNYWQSPAPMRLLAAGTAFWQLSEMVGSDKYINFSSLSMNMQSLLDTGLWMPDKVNDDSGFYWKAYYYFKGEYKVIPHYLPISADANLDTTLWKTFKNAWGQLKRWAYGVEHVPFIFIQYFKRTDVSFWDKTDKLLFISWSYFKWGTLALFIAFAGLLIPIINPSYSHTALAVNLPTVSSWILDGAYLGLFSTIYVHEKTVVPRPKDWNIVLRIWSYLQWLLVPLILVTIATFPAIDAQTTLMLGKHLEFRVTNKARANAS